MAREIAVGIDIGTSSVKAIAADPDGNVVASSRIPHAIQIPAADRFQHDAVVAWREGPLSALGALDLDESPTAVSVAAMVPSLTAVDGDGVPQTPGLLYGDGRGRSENAGGKFTDLAGNVTADGGNALSTNGLLHDEVLAALAPGA